MRIGVQIAQSFGVRVHLHGIEPSRGSQSAQLMNEADTTAEWGIATMKKMLSQRAAAAPAAAPALAAVGLALPSTGNAELDQHVDSFFALLNATDITGVKAYWAAQNHGIPREIDGKLLATARDELGRDLSEPEKRSARSRLSTAVKVAP